jgi:hypothetical protein
MSNLIYRPGKTKRDKASGSYDRCVANKAARAAWQQSGNKDKFPWNTCNGKRNRQI